MKAHGPGLEGGLVGKPAEFTIDTKGAGTGGLGLTVEGPCEAKIECSDNGDGTCSVSYLPTKPGEYFVNILFEEVHIPGSPFKADIEMPFDPSKVVASGPGLQHGKVGEAGLLSVDCSEAGPGALGLEAISDSGAKAEVCIENNKDGTYAVTYVPLTAGMYTLTMKYGGELVPHFPARVKVEPAVDTSRVKVFGPGIEGKGGFHKKRGRLQNNLGLRGHQKCRAELQTNMPTGARWGIRKHSPVVSTSGREGPQQRGEHVAFLLPSPHFVSLRGMGLITASRFSYFSGKARNLVFYVEIQDLSFFGT